MYAWSVLYKIAVVGESLATCFTHVWEIVRASTRVPAIYAVRVLCNAIIGTDPFATVTVAPDPRDLLAFINLRLCITVIVAR